MPLSILVLLVIEKKTGGEKIKVGSEWPRTVLTLRRSAGGSVCGGGWGGGGGLPGRKQRALLLTV